MHAQTYPPGNSTYILMGDSMYPNIRSNDGVIVDSHLPFNNLRVGDIIVFNSYDTVNRGQHIVIIHRVVQIINERQNYIGKVVFVIPQLGTTSADNGVAKIIINGVAKNASYNDLLVVAMIGSAVVVAGYIYRKIHK
jgi:signal peptidase I